MSKDNYAIAPLPWMTALALYASERKLGTAEEQEEVLEEKADVAQDSTSDRVSDDKVPDNVGKYNEVRTPSGAYCSTMPQAQGEQKHIRSYSRDAVDPPFHAHCSVHG